MLLLPICGAQDTVKVDKGWGCLLVRPSIAAAIEIDLLQREIVDNVPESTHQVPVEVSIVFVLIAIE
jgi:hypothetical protein